ncbi:hypothetical protein LOT_0715 [Lentilactobacillus otakiensis DSM 19908 = JCM 15040]|uniref:Uncharacterized protein n=1 Tax=Lentilactobacillus otakiensis DSM 19908 = JCM 15040 TaxID=1423780 RepID=S4NG29_9LACO|nr:hypothetical protein LOT_0715 [Lentilactobacillus otakiensis DSM 19908 = JCM 15040]
MYIFKPELTNVNQTVQKIENEVKAGRKTGKFDLKTSNNLKILYTNLDD